MVEHAQTAPPRRPVVERLFEAAKLPPLLAGTALAPLAVGETVLVAWLFGDLGDFQARGGPCCERVVGAARE